MDLTDKQLGSLAEEAIRAASGDWAQAKAILTEKAAKDPDLQAALVERIISIELRLAATRLGESTKKCRFCAEIIALDAAKCKYCGEWLEAPASASIPVAPPRPVTGAPIIRHFTLLTGWVLIVLIVILIVTFTHG